MHNVISLVDLITYVLAVVLYPVDFHHILVFKNLIIELIIELQLGLYFSKLSLYPLM